MKNLTTKFITASGFTFLETINEDGFCYKHYVFTGLSVELEIFFNYFSDGSITYEVVLDYVELENVGEDELLMLLKILPSAGA